MLRRVPDTSKIERTLGWRATASLDEILGDVIEHELSVNTLEARGASSGARSSRRFTGNPLPGLSA